MLDALGDRMKMYEQAEAGRLFMPLLPVCARIDGKCFHSFTKGMLRPYDPRLSKTMIETTKQLVWATGAVVGYTQSDEISLIWHSDDIRSQIFFNGKIQKMTSVLASWATAHFNRLLNQKEFFDGAWEGRLAMFDCRVWSVPNKTEAVNVLVWREHDATKNSIEMAAREYYSHNELLNKHGGEMQEMLHVKGVNWNDYPAYFKRGTYIQRVTEDTKFTAEEIAKLPLLHSARTNPNLTVMRTTVKERPMPPITKVVNREAVIFDGVEPQLSEE